MKHTNLLIETDKMAEFLPDIAFTRFEEKKAFKAAENI